MKLYVRTFGCQMNFHDSSRIEGLMRRHGFETCEDPSSADVVIVNTCTIREKAWHKAVSETGRMCALKHRRPDLVVALVGCVAEQEGKKLQSTLPALDLVVGPDHYNELPDLIDAAILRGESNVATGFDSGEPKDFLPAPPPDETTAVSAFVTIMKGCSHRCTYCIVPSVRGPERCREAEDIVKEVETLVGAGAREIVLLGQKVNGYVKGDTTFRKLLDRVNNVPGLKRLRFTSPHPRHMTDDVIAAFGELGTLCEAIHLPVQAGSDRVLAAMRRHYTSDEIRDIAAKLRRANPDILITTDLIVGFPGETEKDFEETVRLYEEVRFAGAFSFMYSARPGTYAALHMVDDVQSAVKAERLDRIHRVIDRIERDTKESLVGRTLEVLVEGPAKREGQLTGRARNNQIVNIPFPKDVILDSWRGELKETSIIRALPHCLEGGADREKDECRISG